MPILRSPEWHFFCLSLVVACLTDIVRDVQPVESVVWFLQASAMILGYSLLISLQLGFNWYLSLVHLLSCPLAWMFTYILWWDHLFLSSVLSQQVINEQIHSHTLLEPRAIRIARCVNSLCLSPLFNMTDETGGCLTWPSSSSTANDFSVLVSVPSQLSLWVWCLSDFFVLLPSFLFSKYLSSREDLTCSLLFIYLSSCKI